MKIDCGKVHCFQNPTNTGEKKKRVVTENPNGHKFQCVKKIILFSIGMIFNKV